MAKKVVNLKKKIYLIFEKNGKVWYIILAVCGFSKYVEGDAIAKNDAFSIASFLYHHIYSRYLAPTQVLIYDRDRTFEGDIVKKLNKIFKVKVNITTAGRPEANGQIEVMIKTFKEKLKAKLYEHSKIHFFLSYNST